MHGGFSIPLFRGDEMKGWVIFFTSDNGNHTHVPHLFKSWKEARDFTRNRKIYGGNIKWIDPPEKEGETGCFRYTLPYPCDERERVGDIHIIRILSKGTPC